MAFNPQETPPVFSKEEKDIFIKCSNICYSNNIEIEKYYLASIPYYIIESVFSLDRLAKAASGIDEYGKEEFDKYCKKYGISKEYERYIIKREFNYYVECYEFAIENNIFGLKHPAEKIKELAMEEY